MSLRIVTAAAGLGIVSLAGAITLLSWWPYNGKAISGALVLCGIDCWATRKIRQEICRF